MPANRSRTERWRESLEKISARGGGIELTMARPSGDGSGMWPSDTSADLLWRVRVLDVSDDEVLVECPNAAGQAIELAEGLSLVGIMAVGQNRWMFTTKVIGSGDTDGNGSANGVRLTAPENIERCQRRTFFRTSTAALSLPTVECWPVLSPQTVVSAEVANRALITDLRAKNEVAGDDQNDVLTLPEVGPGFRAKLMNLGGGGVGLVVDPAERSSIEELKLYWLRLDLRPGIPAPLGVTAKIVHTHLDSTMSTYCGIAFEFGFNPSHKQFVVDEISKYAAAIQADQIASFRKAG